MTGPHAAQGRTARHRRGDRHRAAALRRAVEGVKATVDADLAGHAEPDRHDRRGPAAVRRRRGHDHGSSSTRGQSRIDLTGFRAAPKRTVVENYDPTLDSVTLGFDVRSRVPLRIRNNLVDAQLAIDPRGLRVTRHEPAHRSARRARRRSRAVTCACSRTTSRCRRGDPLRRPDAHRAARRHHGAHRVPPLQQHARDARAAAARTRRAAPARRGGGISSGGQRRRPLADHAPRVRRRRRPQGRHDERPGALARGHLLPPHHRSHARRGRSGARRARSMRARRSRRSAPSAASIAP